jgi:2-oxoglutarate dehydrogenase E1 component
MTQRPETPETAITWRKYVGGLCAAPDDVDTRVPRELLGTLAARLCAVPAGFTPHPKIVRLLEQRAQMGRGERPLDWGMAELLAYASLLVQGTNVRLTGQDCGRGTFSHRHAILADVNDGHEHLALASLLPGQAQVGIYDSPLSEAGVLGFEFGFSLDAPDALVLWEAQFGDFANGAQVIIDQFILATEDKWRRLSGLTLLLPHGYEGQGPEHSSARLERFLQGCAEHNIAVSQPTTPAQIFHLLRRQAVRRVRKPLVVMTPKSLLRLPAASSRLGDLEGGAYERILADREVEPGQVTRALFCSGRVYYDLAEERARRKDPTVAIIRIEQLYPWWPELVAASVAPYASLREILWVQDEPANMGAATYAVPRLEPLCHARGVGLDVVSRAESASPATGSHKAHVLEQEQLLREAFDRR